jgi:hypothetical protein
MKLKIIINKYKTYYMRILILLILFSYPFLGSDCNNNVIGGGNNGNIVGNWQLAYMTGYLQDVCYNEIVDFQSNGTVTLQCPGEQSISRTYSISNNVLTYSTGVQYDITTLTNTTLVLEGLNNLGRTLTYTKMSANYVAPPSSVSKGNRNSSDH